MKDKLDLVMVCTVIIIITDVSITRLIIILDYTLPQNMNHNVCIQCILYTNSIIGLINACPSFRIRCSWYNTTFKILLLNI